MRIKMIITDLDGTLLNSKNSISEKNIRAFKKAKEFGVLPVVATGRIDGEAFHFADAIGSTEYVISSNGGVIKDHKNEVVIHEIGLKDKVIKDFLKVFENYDQIFCQAHTVEGNVCTKKTFHWMDNAGWAKAYIREFKDKQIVVEDIYGYTKERGIDINKFVLSSVNIPLLEDLMKNVGLIDGMEVLRPMDYCVECVPTGVDKGYAIIKLCDYLRIDLSEVMVIGDSDNDKEMFELHEPIKIAMGNAYDELKELATQIVGTNDEDGVAEAIEKYVLFENKIG
ncbi:MAG: Cof-type HAD-IIB family hydrolase [Eubacteriaceae bacterium]